MNFELHETPAATSTYCIVGAEPRQQRPLAIPTYDGEPHRDVLVAFFGGSSGSTSTSWYSNAEVTKAMELARPIFADPNLIGLMELNGYNLTGWKPAPVSKGLGKSSLQLSSYAVSLPLSAVATD